MKDERPTGQQASRQRPATQSVDELTARFRAAETFHQLRIPSGDWFATRVDGRSFSKLTSTHFDPPFDEHFHDNMIHVATALLTELAPTAVFFHSDELSLLFSDSWSKFNRGVEKVVSLAASTASAAFTSYSGLCATFDGRVALSGSLTDLAEYCEWRQRDAWRGALNSAAYWEARKTGMPPAAAERETRGTSSEKIRWLATRNVDVFTDVPQWQRRGTLVGWHTVPASGIDPRSGEVHATTRRRLAVIDDLPYGQNFIDMVSTTLSSAELVPFAPQP